MPQNRMARATRDHYLAIVRRPANWEPATLFDVPIGAKVLAVDAVASHAEALDDVLRCNEHALAHELNRWAVLQCPSECCEE